VTSGDRLQPALSLGGVVTVTVSSDSATNWFRYTGRQFDSTGGLYYYRARYYDPMSGRFLSEDPIRFQAGANFYIYTLNSPTSWTDPFGLDVTITKYQGEASNFVGHITISVNDNPPVGFQDSSGFWDALAALDYPVPGAVKPVDPSRPILDTITIPTTPAQDAAMQQYIDNRTQQPGFFQLTTRNCAQFAADALRAGGLAVPYDVLPGSLMQDLHEAYDPPAEVTPPDVQYLLNRPGLFFQIGAR
jgi:RHS repeat-associated protein